MTEPLTGLPLVCPYCGDTIEAELTYSARYSEHRDITGYECDNYACDARWTPYGLVERPSKLPPAIWNPAAVRADERAKVLAEGEWEYGYQTIEAGWVPETKYPLNAMHRRRVLHGEPEWVDGTPLTSEPTP